jgi:hypothetical protein
MPIFILGRTDHHRCAQMMTTDNYEDKTMSTTFARPIKLKETDLEEEIASYLRLLVRMDIKQIRELGFKPRLFREDGYMRYLRLALKRRFAGSRERASQAKNLGALLSPYVQNNRSANEAYEDIQAFGAPSECGGDVERARIHREMIIALEQGIALCHLLGAAEERTTSRFVRNSLPGWQY